MKNLVAHISTLSRRKKIAVQLAVDAALLTLSLLAAILLRLESLSLTAQPALWLALLSSVIATLITFWGLGLYRTIVRYVTGEILFIIGKGSLVAAVLLYVAGLLFEADLPRSIPIIFAAVAFLSVGGLRFIARTFFRAPNTLNKRPVIIYGAGEAGLELLNALTRGYEFAPVALVDDALSLQNMSVEGVRVYSPERIPELVKKTGTRVILLAIPSIARARRQEIVKSLESMRLEVKTTPRMSDIISGKAKISELRAVSAEDLLGRDPVKPVPELLCKTITGRVVMVSGAGGSIGSELCRQILTQNPSVLVLYDVSEFALYSIEAELSETVTRLDSETKIVPILGSVQNSRRLEATIAAFRVETIYHAAAYKHVPLVEENVIEGVRNNVFGTLSIARAASKLGVLNFILVSTDKAVRPTNVMGASKRVCELICQALAQKTSTTTFSMVRFGNVLGSSGSVIPRFRSQIESGGPVTVTHRDINRYFMTIPEAAQLVIQAGALGKGGDVFVLDMGKPVKIVDLAFSMVKLHGLIPYMAESLDQISPDKGDIPICVTGLRKGEKLYEELLIGNNPEPTVHPRIMTASEVLVPHDVLMVILERLLAACETFDLPSVVSILHELPLDYSPLSADFKDLLWAAEQETKKEQAAEFRARKYA